MAKRKKANSNIFTSLLYIIVGILLIAFPENALNIAMIVAGVVFLIFGILEIVRKNWVTGVISLVVGLVLLIFGGEFISIVLVVLGVLIVIKGIVALINALRHKRVSTWEVVFAILTIVVGLIIVFGNALNWLLIIGGALLIIDGVLGLISYFKKK